MANNEQQQYAEYERLWEQDRLQRQEAERVQNLDYTRQELRAERELRDQRAAEGNWEAAREHDSNVATFAEQERALTPLPQPQLSQSDINFLNRKQAFREKYGAAADQTIAMAHQRAVMPRNPHATSTTNPMTYGHGLRPGTPAYYQAVHKELEVNGHLAGTPYDPSGDLPTWKDPQIRSGLSEQEYLKAYQDLKRQGRVR